VCLNPDYAVDRLEGSFTILTFSDSSYVVYVAYVENSGTGWTLRDSSFAFGHSSFVTGSFDMLRPDIARSSVPTHHGPLTSSTVSHLRALP